ncbi:class I SAM-dependent methyltransferase [Paenibacillus chartarius]|uniref:Class I SAM-dependent methyltransferase n=1 Tax=Paenibacillus chartarius TaxID=747481 RepID=A0ABV6DMP8_9BACL
MSNLLWEYLRSQDSFRTLVSLHPSPEGNILEFTDAETASAQIEFFRYIIASLQPTKILETGTNKALFAYLLSHILPKPATLYTFGLEPESGKCVNYLNSIQNKLQIKFYQGDSKQTLPHFHEQGIEFAWVDGGHDEVTAYSDIVNCVRLNIPYIAIDDLRHSPHLQAVVQRVLNEYPNYKYGENPFYHKDSRGAVLIVRSEGSSLLNRFKI